MLQALSRTVLAGLRSTEIFGRLGGEEFAVALPSTGLDGARVVAERLRRSVEELKVSAEGRTVSFTISIGVAEIIEADGSFASILSRADQALYRAKSDGRNRVESAREGARSTSQAG